jgi:bifunctional ADP-heptose synthase (sugar kinase/adenylyltransferase)
LGNSLVAVLGDSCLDVFVYCHAKRLAPDLPIPVLEKIIEQTNPGMAMNVARNLEAVGLEVQLTTNDNWRQNSKTRFVDRKSNHSFLRLDSGEPIQALETIPDLSPYDAVVIADYDKGFLSEDLIGQILSLHPRCFLDTKKVLGSWASNAYLIKINDYEYSRSESYIKSDSNIQRKIVRTMGGEGAEFDGVKYPALNVDVLDSSGAGDAFMAALVAGVLRTESIPEAIAFANLQASEVVKHRGVTTIHD